MRESLHRVYAPAARRSLAVRDNVASARGAASNSTACRPMVCNSCQRRVQLRLDILQLQTGAALGRFGKGGGLPLGGLPFLLGRRLFGSRSGRWPRSGRSHNAVAYRRIRRRSVDDVRRRGRTRPRSPCARLRSDGSIPPAPAEIASRPFRSARGSSRNDLATRPARARPPRRRVGPRESAVRRAKRAQSWS